MMTARDRIEAGKQYRDANNFNAASAEYKAAITLEPNNGEAYYRIGELFMLQKDFAQAIQNYNDAIRLGFSEARVYFHRGYCYEFQREHLAQALADYRQTIYLRPDHQKSRTISAGFSSPKALSMKPFTIIAVRFS